MPSTLFYLTTRLSPQTTGVRILPPGGLPEVTKDDVHRAVGCIQDATSWQCINAKWLDNEKALDGLLKMVEARSWARWRKDKRTAQINVFMNQRMAEVALLGWLYPHNSRSSEGVRGYIEAELKPFKASYYPHIQAMANWLQAKEDDGWQDMNGFLWEAA